MSGIGTDLVKALLILLPGFVTLKIVEGLAHVRPQRTDLDRVILGLVYTVVDYVACIVLLWLARPLPGVRYAYSAVAFYVVSGLKLRRIPPVIPPDGLLALPVVVFSVAVLAGIAMAWNNTGDWTHTTLRKLGITRRTGRPTIWADTFVSMKGLAGLAVAVNFADRRRIMGQVVRYADTPEEGALFLTNVSWVSYDEESKELRFLPVPGPGVLLTKACKIESIEFLYPADSTTEGNVPSPATYN